MHLIQTVKGSQFYRFYSNSQVADDIYSPEGPSIANKPIVVLQIASTNSVRYDTIIEFMYLYKIEGK